MTRRSFFSAGRVAYSPTSFLRRPTIVSGAGKTTGSLPDSEKNRKLKVVFVGAHVDDWIFCVGTLARYTREGHDVLCYS